MAFRLFRLGRSPPLESEKTEFQGKSNVISVQNDPLEIHLDNLKAIRSGGLKQLPGPSLQVSRLHFQGKFPPAPAATSSGTPMHMSIRRNVISDSKAFCHSSSGKLKWKLPYAFAAVKVLCVSRHVKRT